MQDLYFWVSLPLLLGIGQSSIPNKILEAKNSLEVISSQTLESHIKKSKEHLDEIADSPDLTEDYIIVMQNQIQLFASLIFRKRQRLIVGSIEIITSRLKEIFKEIERDITSFKTLSPKNLKAICEKIVSQIKKESSSTRTNKEMASFNK